ncbi:molybdopterin-binding protein [Aquipuribacter sp. SD81]|uniref:molybdopterin-binding protein n=1 Tax=Aquipuribacter sp. SD81 TaxID=3127703 RepID=UPI00301B2131
MTGPVGLDDAREAARALGTARVPRHVPVALERAHGRVLAVEVRAAGAVPPVDVAAVDGWAVAGAGPWRVLGAAEVVGDVLPPGAATVVVTGAPLPRGADRVVRDVDGSVSREASDVPVLTLGRSTGRDHVRPRGQEMAAGEVVLPRGTVLRPLALGLAAAAGVDAVHVVVPPRTALLVTGEGLVGTGPSRPARTRDSLTHVLPDLLVALGADLGHDLARTSRLGDDPDALADVLSGPYRSTVDVVVVSGGTGRGRGDHLRRVLGQVGAHVVVDGLDVRPGGSALLAAVPDGPVVVGLPGEPAGAVLATVLLAGPLLAGWLGAPVADLSPVRLAGEVPAGPWPCALPAALDLATGAARPLAHARAGMLRGLAACDGLVVVGAGGAARWLPLPV